MKNENKKRQGRASERARQQVREVFKKEREFEKEKKQGSSLQGTPEG